MTDMHRQLGRQGEGDLKAKLTSDLSALGDLTAKMKMSLAKPEPSAPVVQQQNPFEYINDFTMTQGTRSDLQ